MGLEAGADQGVEVEIERRELKNQDLAEAEAGHLFHLPSEAETLDGCQKSIRKGKEIIRTTRKGNVEKQKQETAAVAAATGDSVLNVAATLASGMQVTPQIAMEAQMVALQAKALAETGIAVPTYCNPAAVNPGKFAEQKKRRKMLWQGKKGGNTSQPAEVWEELNFGNKDQNVKFRKLMGIKSEDEAGCSSADEESYRILKQQQEVFRNLDAQYEVASLQTHTQRGINGFGFHIFNVWNGYSLKTYQFGTL